MSLDLAAWKAAFISAISATFGDRIVCAGLQGSRARNEARPDSDIDAVLILDRLSEDDLFTCRKLFHSLPESDLICGFVSGKKELAHWDTGELVSFYFDTEPLIGNLEFIRPLVTPQTARKAVHAGACGIYHACCHSTVFGDGSIDLPSLYKAAFFILRAKHYAQTGIFVKRSVDLLQLLNAHDQAILQLHLEPSTPALDSSNVFHKAEALRVWSGKLIAEFNAFPADPS